MEKIKLFHPGMKIKLKNYTGWADYREHNNQTATIKEIDDSPNLSMRVQWKDGTYSYISRNNIRFPSSRLQKLKNTVIQNNG